MVFFEVSTQKNIPHSILTHFGQHFFKTSVINEHFLGNLPLFDGEWEKGRRKKAQLRYDHLDHSSAIPKVSEPYFLQRCIRNGIICDSVRKKWVWVSKVSFLGNFSTKIDKKLSNFRRKSKMWLNLTPIWESVTRVRHQNSTPDSPHYDMIVFFLIKHVLRRITCDTWQKNRDPVGSLPILYNMKRVRIFFVKNIFNFLSHTPSLTLKFWG